MAAAPDRAVPAASAGRRTRATRAGLVSSAGTPRGGGLDPSSGVTRALKEREPSSTSFAVEPEGAAALAGKTVSQPNHPIEGGGFARPDLTHLRDRDVPLTGTCRSPAIEARSTSRLLATREGIFAGFSAGANVDAALRLLRNELSGATIALVIPEAYLRSAVR